MLDVCIQEREGKRIRASFAPASLPLLMHSPLSRLYTKPSSARHLQNSLGGRRTNSESSVVCKRSRTTATRHVPRTVCEDVQRKTPKRYRDHNIESSTHSYTLHGDKSTQADTTHIQTCKRGKKKNRIKSLCSSRHFASFEGGGASVQCQCVETRTGQMGSLRPGT